MDSEFTGDDDDDDDDPLQPLDYPFSPLSRKAIKRRNISNLQQIEFLTKIRKLNYSPPINIAIKTFFSHIIVLTSTLSAVGKSNLKADISILGGVILDEWSDTCTHLVMENVTFTAKLMQSLCLGIPIVTPDFFQALLSSNQLQHELPDVESFQTPITLNPLIGLTVSLKVNVERKRLFAGKTFVFMTQRHMDVYKTMIECAMGKCISVSGKRVNVNTLVEPGIIVIDSSTGSTHSRLKDSLRSKESRMVPHTDIILAILNCSLETFCNPKQQVANSQKFLRLLLNNDACLSHILSYLDEQDKISFAELSPIKTSMETEASASTDVSKLILFDKQKVQIGWGNVKNWSVGSGMSNLGNSCYLNATLQALFHVPSFATWLHSDGEHHHCTVNCMICSMANVLQSTQSGMHHIQPVAVYSKLNQINRHLVKGQQEDAYEFLLSLMESMHNAYLLRFENSKDFDECTKETTPICQIFGGSLRSSVTCLTCKFESVTFQYFQDLQLDIRNVNTIEEALRNHFDTEVLGAKDYKCGYCKKKVLAKKQVSLERAPVVLCIQLKRFSATNEKINKHISIAPNINIGQHSHQDEKNSQLNYRLVSMITHVGTTTRVGHYTTTSRVQDGSYHIFDDEMVQLISTEDLQNTNPYIIFYELIDDNDVMPRCFDLTEEPSFRESNQHDVENTSAYHSDILNNPEYFESERSNLDDSAFDKNGNLDLTEDGNFDLTEEPSFRESNQHDVENTSAYYSDIFNNPEYFESERSNLDDSAFDKNGNLRDMLNKVFKLPPNVPANISPIKNNRRYLRKKPKRNKLGKHLLRVGIQQKLYTGLMHPVPSFGVTMTRATTDNKKRNKKGKNVKIRKKVLRRNRKHLDPFEERFTIVRGLPSFLKKTDIADKLLHQIEQDVLLVSALSIEASYMIHLYYTTLFNKNPHMVMKHEPCFRKIFVCLKENAHEKKANVTRDVHKQYFDLRNRHGIKYLYDGQHKTNIINIAADRYKVNLHNNVVDHMYKRIRKFFNIACPDIPSYSTLDTLFKWHSTLEPDERLIRALHDHLNFDGNFWKFKKKWWSFLPFLHRLQSWLHMKSVKNFRIFPILRNRRHHVHYDGQALQQLLNNFKVVNCKYEHFNEDMEWRKYFKIEDVETTPNINDTTFGHKFFTSISTNGVSVSINMKRKVIPVSETDRTENIRKSLKSGEIKDMIGLDPGERLVFGGVSRNVTTGQETSIRYNSDSFRYDAGEFRVTSKYRAITNALFKEIENERNSIPNKASSMADPVVFVSFQLKHFERLNELLFTKKIAKLEFQRYIARRRAVEALAREITGGNRSKNKPIVFVGTTETSPIIKGYVRSPKKSMIASMKKYAHVIKVWEFRSTMLCSTCFQPAVTSTSPHRWQHCKKCDIVWNRDVNAGRNILYLGLQTLMQQPINQRFSADFHFPKNANGYKVKNNTLPWTKRSSRLWRKLNKLQPAVL